MQTADCVVFAAIVLCSRKCYAVDVNDVIAAHGSTNIVENSYYCTIVLYTTTERHRSYKYKCIMFNKYAKPELNWRPLGSCGGAKWIAVATL